MKRYRVEVVWDKPHGWTPQGMHSYLGGGKQYTSMRHAENCARTCIREGAREAVVIDVDRDVVTDRYFPDLTMFSGLDIPYQKWREKSDVPPSSIGRKAKV
jgi:hypothetical protein